MAHNRRNHDTIANFALFLADAAKSQAHQYRMQKARAGRTPGAYDLAALSASVDTSAPSDSETGYEDRG